MSSQNRRSPTQQGVARPLDKETQPSMQALRKETNVIKSLVRKRDEIFRKHGIILTESQKDGKQGPDHLIVLAHGLSGTSQDCKSRACIKLVFILQARIRRVSTANASVAGKTVHVLMHETHGPL
jgi:hypothetical protein